MTTAPLRVVITGGASGIGLVVADRFLADGCRVAVCDADPAAISQAVAARPDLVGMVADVTDESSMLAFFAHVEAELAGADVVIANAGTAGPAGRIEDLDLAEYRACLSTTLDGSFLTCRWAARVLRKQGSGLIVLMSSTAGLYGYPLRSPYAVGKWGVIGLMKTLAMELGPAGVRVNAICPGAVEGDRMDRVVAKESAASGDAPEVVRARYVEGVSLRTWVTADDVADLIAYLASPAGQRLSGQALAVDGHTETLAP